MDIGEPKRIWESEPLDDPATLPSEPPPAKPPPKKLEPVPAP